MENENQNLKEKRRKIAEEARHWRIRGTSKIEACPFKKEIEEMIYKDYGSRRIEKILKEKYPEYQHLIPSYRTICHYRRKLLRQIQKGEILPPLYPPVKKALQNLEIKNFDVIKEADKMWRFTNKMMDKMEKMIDEIDLPPKVMVEFLKVVGQNYQIVSEILMKTGIIESKPVEIEVKQHINYEEKVKRLQGFIVALARRIDKNLPENAERFFQLPSTITQEQGPSGSGPSN